MADPTPLELAIAALIVEVKKRCRFSYFDTLVPTPSDDEITAALYDTQDDINSFPPETASDLLSTYGNVDTRWKRLLILGACVYSLDYMIAEFTANGVDIQAGEFALPNKTGELQGLRESMFTLFTTQLEKLKQSSQKFCHYRNYATGPSAYSSAGAYRRYKNYNYTRMSG